MQPKKQRGKSNKKYKIQYKIQYKKAVELRKD